MASGREYHFDSMRNCPVYSQPTEDHTFGCVKIGTGLNQNDFLKGVNRYFFGIRFF